MFIMLIVILYALEHLSFYHTHAYTHYRGVHNGNWTRLEVLNFSYSLLLCHPTLVDNDITR